MTNTATPRPRAALLRGILRLAIGRADGLAAFADTTPAFLSSLAPLIALPLVGAILGLAGGAGLPALTDLAQSLVAVLAPAVFSHAIAVRLGRGALWLRYASAFNWCQWAIPLLALGLMLLLDLALAAGLDDQMAIGVLVLALLVYGLWLHWFLARHGLALSARQAVLVVVGVNLPTALLVVGPPLLEAALHARPLGGGG